MEHSSLAFVGLMGVGLPVAISWAAGDSADKTIKIDSGAESDETLAVTPSSWVS